MEPSSDETGRHVRGELHKQHAYIDVSYSCLVGVYHCFLSMPSATTSKVASIVLVMRTEACSSATALREHTLDNRFHVSRQSIGSYSNGKAKDAWDRYRMALFEP